jgi:hypothetical protein
LLLAFFGPFANGVADIQLPYTVFIVGRAMVLILFAELGCAIIARLPHGPRSGSSMIRIVIARSAIIATCNARSLFKL